MAVNLHIVNIARKNQNPKQRLTPIYLRYVYLSNSIVFCTFKGQRTFVNNNKVSQNGELQLTLLTGR